MEIVTNEKLLGNSYPGNIVGSSVTLETGIVGKALRIAAANSYVNLGPIRDNCFGFPDLCPNGYTLALWLKRKQIGTSHNFYISNGGQTYISYGITVHGSDSNTIGITVKTTSKRWRIIQLTVPEGSWHHILFTWTESNGVYAYVNGIFDKMVTSPE